MKGLVLLGTLALVTSIVAARYKVNAEGSSTPATVNASRMARADQEPGNWMSYGRTYSEQHFSPLNLINDQNVSRLKLAWFYDLDTHRGQEATPPVIDGVMYFTSAWSKVF